MIKVVNKHKHVPTHNDFYIGRGSGLGNPYTHQPLETTKAEFQVKTRDEAIKMYRDNFGRILRSDVEANKLFSELLMRALMKLDINLVCYCEPQKCHGHVLKEFLDDSVRVLERIIPMNELKTTEIPGLYIIDDRFEVYSLYNLVDFMQDVAEGNLIDYDDGIANVLIDGKNTNICVAEWGGYYDGGKPIKAIRLELQDLMDIKGRVTINWANR